MAANDSKSYLSYLNKLLDQYNNTYHQPNFNDRIRITKYKNIFSKGYTENWSRVIFIIDSVLKTNLWTHKIKDFNREKIGSFYEKELLQSKL